MQTFNLDISKRIMPEMLYAKQRDVGAKICIKLTDNEAEYVVPDGVMWSVWYSGAGVEGNYDKIDSRDAVVVNGGTATVELIYQMLDNPGPGEMCLVMNSADGTQMGLWNIPYFVEAIPGADSKAAEAYYQAFLDAQKRAKEAADRAEDAADRAESAGGGSGGGTIIVSLDEGYFATHTALDIHNAMKEHNVAVYHHIDGTIDEFISLKYTSQTRAVFTKVGYPTDFDVFNIQIGANGEVSYDTYFSSELVGQTVDAVLAALPTYNGEVEPV